MATVKTDVTESLKSKWKWKIMNGKIHKSIIQQVVSINLERANRSIGYCRSYVELVPQRLALE